MQGMPLHTTITVHFAMLAIDSSLISSSRDGSRTNFGVSFIKSGIVSLANRKNNLAKQAELCCI